MASPGIPRNPGGSAGYAHLPGGDSTSLVSTGAVGRTAQRDPPMMELSVVREGFRSQANFTVCVECVGVAKISRFGAHDGS